MPLTQRSRIVLDRNRWARHRRGPPRRRPPGAQGRGRRRQRRADRRGRRGPAAPPAPPSRLCGYLVRLPVGHEDPLARPREVRTAMDRNKEAGTSAARGPPPCSPSTCRPSATASEGPPWPRPRGCSSTSSSPVSRCPAPGSGSGRPLTEVHPLAPLARGQSLAVAVLPGARALRPARRRHRRARPGPPRARSAGGAGGAGGGVRAGRGFGDRGRRYVKLGFWSYRGPPEAPRHGMT